jgi:prepilin-type N-terminal cleavage/methylation domain-containing protein
MSRKTNQGFTIVELLIVIVVIAILAAISVVAYQGIQVRARDAMRTEAINKIKKALELYKIDHGRYPAATVNPGVGGWEASTDAEGSFLEHLANYGLPGGGPLDPINEGTNAILYYRYAAGGSSGTGCDSSKGGFYVLRVRYEDPGNKPEGNSIEPYCTNPQASWIGSSNMYVFHSFEN